MSDPINANPTVLDVSELPTRQENDDAFEELYYSNAKSGNARNTVTLLDTFSRDVLTSDLWNQYHGQSNELYSVIDEEDEVSDPEAGSGLSESEDEHEQHQQQTTDIENIQMPGNLPHRLSSDSKPEDSLVTKTQSRLQSAERYDPIDAQEIYDLISTINDPEHPLSLGQLSVVNLPHIYVTDSGNPDEIAEVFVEITPTITHCSLATLIGLGLRVRLERALPPRFRIIIKVRPGTHQSEKQVNKQLNDKERVAAACENQQLLGVISSMLSSCT